MQRREYLKSLPLTMDKKVGLNLKAEIQNLKYATESLRQEKSQVRGLEMTDTITLDEAKIFIELF